jgi:phosphatidate cytidylyltransferase
MNLGNTSTRILISVIAIPVIVALCYIGKIPFLIFILAIGLLSYYEFSNMVQHKESYTNLIIDSFAIICLIINSYYAFINYEILIICIIILLVITELFRNNKSVIFNLGASLIGIFYIGIFASTIISIREFFADSNVVYTEGGYIIISMLATIWICDSAAFFLGTAFGKHKLFPRVSPNKTWEGAIAGFVFAVLTMIASKVIILDFLIWRDVIVIGIIIGVLGQIGDLMESLIKRDTGVKDSSGIIPGHGGVFDRFDSFFFSAPFVYLYLLFFIS